MGVTSATSRGSFPPPRTTRACAPAFASAQDSRSAQLAAELRKLLGRNAVWLWGIAKGLEELPVEERPDPKSISVERTFDRDVSEWPVVQDTLRDVARNVFLRARAQGAEFRTIGIKVRYEGFQTHLRDRTLSSHVLDEGVLRDVSLELLQEFDSPGRRFRLLGVRVTNLQRPKTKQPRLSAFEDLSR